MRKIIIYICLLLMMISIVNAGLLDLIKESSDLNNVQFSNGDTVAMKIKTVGPIIVSSDDITGNFKYKFKQVDIDRWEVQYCFKDYDKDYVKKTKSEKDRYKEIPTSTIAGSPVASLKLTADKQCNTFLLGGVVGDILKLGGHSTIIAIVEQNVTFAITPEYQNCNYLSCTSNVILENLNNFAITINSSDLSASVDGAIKTDIMFDYTYEKNIIVDDYEYDEFYTNYTIVGSHNKLVNITRTANIDENIDIIIPANESKKFTLYAIIEQPESQFKYNVSLFYYDVEHKIDPYFNTTNSTFINGYYNNTFLNNSGFVQLNASYYNGTYLSEIFVDNGKIINIDNISWTEGGYYKSELPNNGIIESGFNGINMSGNIMLYHFDESSGALIDYSGRNNNATLYYNPVYSLSGVINNSIGFYGEAMARSNVINRNTNAITVSMWVYLNQYSPGVGAWLSNQRDGGSSGDQWQMYVYSDNKLNLMLFGVSGATWQLVDTDLFPTKKWTHVAFTTNGTTTGQIKMYKDGKLVKTDTLTQNVRYANTLVVLGSMAWIYPSTNGLLNGSIDEFAYWNRTLSDDEIKNIYERGALNLNLSLRTCNDANCDVETWTNIKGKSPQDIIIQNNTYFQYKFDFTSFNLNDTPKLYNVTVGYTSLYPVILGLSYSLKVPIDSENNFIWSTDKIANASLRIWNTSLSYDNTEYNSTLSYSHSMLSGLLPMGLYNFNVTSCNSYDCDSIAGTYEVVDISMNFDFNHTDYMRNESIASSITDELRLNYTEGNILADGYIITCNLTELNTLSLIKIVNLTDLGTGWYNYPDFYTFPTDAISNTYRITCENVNRSLLDTQDIGLYDTGITSSTAVSRTSDVDGISYTFNVALYNIRDEYLFNISINHTLVNNNSEAWIYYDNNNSYIYGFNYSFFDVNLSISPYSIYNYNEEIISAIIDTGWNTTYVVFQDVLYNFTYVDNMSNGSIFINSTFNTGTSNMNIYTINDSFYAYGFKQSSITITDDTLQEISYPSTREKNNTNEHDICPDVVLKNARNDSDMMFTWSISGYNSNGTCLLDVTDQDIGDYIFNITTTPDDGLNAIKTVSYSYTIEPYINTNPTIEQIGIGDYNDTGDYISGSFSVYVKIADDESDLTNITSVQWVIPGVTNYPVMDLTSWKLSNIVTTPTGVWHNFSINSNELGKGVYPGVRLLITLNGGNNNYSTYFLVDNTDVFEIPVEPTTTVISEFVVQTPCNSTCNVSFKLSEPSSTPISITNLEWVLSFPSTATFGVINTSLLMTSLSTSPTGITHSFLINSEYELGRYVYPGVRIKMTVTGNSNTLSNYFLVDNIPSLTAQNVWTYNGRYINGEII